MKPPLKFDSGTAIFEGCVRHLEYRFGRSFCDVLFENHVVGHSCTHDKSTQIATQNFDIGSDAAMVEYQHLQGLAFIFTYREHEYEGHINLRQSS